jgi:hypothetical protein
MFNKTYELSLNKNYVQHWGLAEAVRELIQNAIDSESPFVYEFEREDGEIILILKSEFTTLSPQTLLLGSTSKAGNTDKIGSFGEGYKIALLVLTRLGNKVKIANGEKLWQPAFQYNSKFGEDLLVIKESSLPYKHQGLTFEIHGLTDNDVDAIVESCLLMQNHVGAIKQTQYGDILLDKPGMLYVGGLFICETELKYGYNLKPDQIKLERDRQTVSSFDLQFITKNMWIETGEYDRLAELIEEETPDTVYVEYGSTEMVREACYKLFRSKNPGAIAVKSQAELEELVDKGMTTVVVGSSYHSQIVNSKSYKEENPIKIESVEDRLHRFLRENRSKMQSAAIVNFKKLITESKRWRHR